MKCSEFHSEWNLNRKKITVNLSMFQTFWRSQYFFVFPGTPSANGTGGAGTGTGKKNSAGTAGTGTGTGSKPSLSTVERVRKDVPPIATRRLTDADVFQGNKINPQAVKEHFLQEGRLKVC